MERSVWTDERLGDRFDEIGRRFDRVDGEIADLRAETHEGFAQLRSEMTEGFGEVRGEINGVRGEINDLRTELRVVMYRVGGGVMVGLIGVIAAILARGA
jgi:hypothetical protein